MLKISAVAKGSVGAELKLRAGDAVIRFDDSSAEDILDYLFYNSQERFTLTVRRGSRETEFEVEKFEDEDLGLSFESEELTPKRCRNRCVFCFVDQLPKNMRDTLYVKDDDYRLSFISGNYVTLTNVSDTDIDRIIKYRLSPLYISVHTLNEALRVKMTGNRFAGGMAVKLRKLAEGGITLNCQVVLCPGLNDGEELASTLKGLAALGGAVQSVAIVPVGLTGHRSGLAKLTPVGETEARDAIAITERFNEGLGREFAYCSDEMYLRAKLPLPPYESYGEFGQIENGVGLVSKLEREFGEALSEAQASESPRSVTVITGASAKELIRGLAERLMSKFPRLRVQVIGVVNTFFGSSVTVAGLVTAGDIIANRQEIDESATEVIIPRCMLKEFESVFLDGISLGELEERLSRKVTVAEVTGEGFISAVTGGGS